MKVLFFVKWLSKWGIRAAVRTIGIVLFTVISPIISVLALCLPVILVFSLTEVLKMNHWLSTSLYIVACGVGILGMVKTFVWLTDKIFDRWLDDDEDFDSDL